MKKLSTSEVEMLLNEGKSVNIIDVREVEEVKEGMIPGAIHIPLGLLEFRLHELDKEKDYIMVCRSGGRSARAYELLESRGYTVTNMTGGMLDWNGETK